MDSTGAFFASQLGISQMPSKSDVEAGECCWRVPVTEVRHGLDRNCHATLMQECGSSGLD